MSNHTEIIFIRGMYTTAIPAAMRTLPTARARKLSPNIVMNEPAVAIARNMDDAFRGPRRSDRIPLGICMRA